MRAAFSRWIYIVIFIVPMSIPIFYQCFERTKDIVCFATQKKEELTQYGRPEEAGHKFPILSIDRKDIEKYFIYNKSNSKVYWYQEEQLLSKMFKKPVEIHYDF